MKPLSRPQVLGWGTLAFAVGAAVTAAMISFGYNPLVVTPWLGMLFVLIGIGTLWFGLSIRKHQHGHYTRLNAIQMARVAIFARSTVTNGAIFTGSLVGISAVSATRAWASVPLEATWSAGLAAAGALVMTVLGAIVEHWSRDVQDPKDRADSSNPDRKPGMSGTAQRESSPQT